jgi:hypothetical protein
MFIVGKLYKTNSEMWTFVGPPSKRITKSTPASVPPIKLKANEIFLVLAIHSLNKKHFISSHEVRILYKEEVKWIFSEREFASVLIS